MLFLELQRGKAGMASQQYQQKLGTTAACTLWLATGCVSAEDDRHHTIQGVAWFGSVKANAALGHKGIRAVLQVKNNKALYPKEYIEKVLENSPGGVHIVLKGTAPNGVDLIAIGYRYSTKPILFCCYSQCRIYKAWKRVWDEVHRWPWKCLCLLSGASWCYIYLFWQFKQNWQT